MLLKFFMSVAVWAGLASMAPNTASADWNTGCHIGVACNILHAGHERGRTPIACVSIPFEKPGYGQIAMFVLRHYDPSISLDAQIDEADNLIFKDSKIAASHDDFCRNPKYFAGARAVVLCDNENGSGWLRGETLAITIVQRRPPNGGRIHVGLF
ncbi:MAG TPA: hypothetical protein VMU13_02905 [Candidatus Paceibacterota bacterium]|nr:hypothetical protein [Candidatus Paceibacterota bacterium]